MFSKRFAIALCLALASFHAHPALAKCAIRSVQNPNGTTSSVTAVEPDTGSRELDNSGYKETTCAAVDKEAHLKKVCSPRDWGNGGVQRQYEVQAGLSLPRLCAAARAEAGLPELTSDEVRARFSTGGRDDVFSKRAIKSTESVDLANPTVIQSGGQ